MSDKKYPIHLGEEGTEQFTITTRVNGEQIRNQKIHDPFIHCSVKMRGFKHAWNALFGGIKVDVSVNGSEGVSRAIMTLNPYELEKETAKILEARRVSRESQGASDVAMGSDMATSRGEMNDK